MKILLPNDDGIGAEGLSALEKAIPGELYVAAPANHVSECSHRITTRQPLPMEQRGDRRWAIDGSPADCVRVALNYLYADILQKVYLHKITLRDRKRSFFNINLRVKVILL